MNREKKGKKKFETEFLIYSPFSIISYLNKNRGPLSRSSWFVYCAFRVRLVLI